MRRLREEQRLIVAEFLSCVSLDQRQFRKSRKSAAERISNDDLTVLGTDISVFGLAKASVESEASEAKNDTEVHHQILDYYQKSTMDASAPSSKTAVLLGASGSGTMKFIKTICGTLEHCYVEIPQPVEKLIGRISSSSINVVAISDVDTCDFRILYSTLEETFDSHQVYGVYVFGMHDDFQKVKDITSKLLHFIDAASVKVAVLCNPAANKRDMLKLKGKCRRFLKKPAIYVDALPISEKASDLVKFIRMNLEHRSKISLMKLTSAKVSSSQDQDISRKRKQRDGGTSSRERLVKYATADDTNQAVVLSSKKVLAKEKQERRNASTQRALISQPSLDVPGAQLFGVHSSSINDYPNDRGDRVLVQECTRQAPMQHYSMSRGLMSGFHRDKVSHEVVLSLGRGYTQNLIHSFGSCSLADASKNHSKTDALLDRDLDEVDDELDQLGSSKLNKKPLQPEMDITGMGFEAGFGTLKDNQGAGKHEFPPKMPQICGAVLSSDETRKVSEASKSNNRTLNRPTIVLFGKVGNGKTALFNKLCGAFHDSHPGVESCTRQVQFGRSLLNDLVVVDTPGFYATTDIESYVEQWKTLLGSHLIGGVYVVVKYGRADDIIPFMNTVMDFVGDDDVRIVITHKDVHCNATTYNEESLKESLFESLDVPVKNMLLVGKDTTAKSLEDFICSTLHDARRFDVTSDQVAAVSALPVQQRLPEQGNMNSPDTTISSRQSGSSYVSATTGAIFQSTSNSDKSDTISKDPPDTRTISKNASDAHKICVDDSPNTPLVTSGGEFKISCLSEDITACDQWLREKNQLACPNDPEGICVLNGFDQVQTSPNGFEVITNANTTTPRAPILLLGKDHSGIADLVGKLSVQSYPLMVESDLVSGQQWTCKILQANVDVVHIPHSHDDTMESYIGTSMSTYELYTNNEVKEYEHRGIYVVVEYGRIGDMVAYLRKMMGFVGNDIRIIVVATRNFCAKEQQWQHGDPTTHLSKKLDVSTNSIFVWKSGDANACLLEEFISSTMHAERIFSITCNAGADEEKEPAETEDEDRDATNCLERCIRALSDFLSSIVCHE